MNWQRTDNADDLIRLDSDFQSRIIGNDRMIEKILDDLAALGDADWRKSRHNNQSCDDALVLQSDRAFKIENGAAVSKTIMKISSEGLALSSVITERSRIIWLR